jgi:predicted RND superfamily exporter protein
LVDDPFELAGSPIVLSVPTTLTRATTNAASVPSTALWQSHIEMITPQSAGISTRLAPGTMDPDFKRGMASATHVAMELYVRTHFRPGLIKDLDGLAAMIRQHSEWQVGGVLGPHDYLSTTRFMARPNDPDARRLPDDAGEIKLMWDYYALARGKDKLRQIVDTNYWQSLTTVFLKDANFQDVRKLMAAISKHEKENLSPKGIKIEFAGDVAVSQSLINSIVVTQLQSLVLSLIGIFVVTSLFGRSLLFGLYCLLPSLAAIVIKFAIMGWSGIFLGVATSTFAAMTLGIGVNCAIHLLEGWRQGREDGSTGREALVRSFQQTGPPALINTAAMSLGFGVLIFSQVPANARLGLLLVLGLVLCFVLSLVLLPLLLSCRSPGFTRRRECT